MDRDIVQNTFYMIDVVVVNVYVLTLHAIATLHIAVNCNIDLMWTFF